MTSDVLKNGQGRYDSLRILLAIVPIATLALVGWLFLRGMLETPQQKKSRINVLIEERLQSHKRLEGHPVMVERVTNITERLDEIKDQVKDNAKVLDRIETKLD